MTVIVQPTTPLDESATDVSPLTRLLNLPDRRESRVAVVAEWVGRAIIEGRLQPTEDLNSAELARRFDTSRTPVREALMLLEKEGLVEMPPRRRPRVARTDLGQVRDIYAVRAHLLAMVAELVAAARDAEAIDALRERHAVMAAAAASGELDAYFWANVAFHDEATARCGNPTLRRVVDSLGLRVLQMRHFSLSQSGRVERSLQDHGRLLSAIEDGSVSLAGELNRSIVLGALAVIEASGWTGLPGDDLPKA